MWNAGLDESQGGIKIAGRNINNLRYADDTTSVAENEEELRSLLLKVKKESEKAGLKLNIQKTKIMASGSIVSWQISGGYVQKVSDFIFLGSKFTADSDCSHKIKRLLLLGRIAMSNLYSVLNSWRHHFVDQGLSSQSYGFSSSHVWTIKKTECRRIDVFELWCWRRLQSPLDCKSKPVNLKEISPKYSL